MSQGVSLGPPAPLPQLYTTNKKEYNRRVRRIAQKSVEG